MRRLLSSILVLVQLVPALAAQAHFTDPPGFVARYGARGAVDPGTGALYVVGGRWDLVLDLWRLQGGQWQQLASLPVTGHVAGLAFDPMRNRLVASIGPESPLNQLHQLYEFDGTSWTWGLDMYGGPAELLHDPVRNLLLVFGRPSWSFQAYQLWSWDGIALTMQPMVGQPGSGIAGTGTLAFDAVSGRVVCVGGNQVHEWNGANWTSTAVSVPFSSSVATTDPASGRVVHLQDGLITPLAWTWTGQAFVPLSTAGLPARYQPVFCGNATTGSLLVVAGRGLDNRPHGDTWMRAAASWQQVLPDTGDPRLGPVVATGPGQALAVDERDSFTWTPLRTWRFQNGVWTELQPATSPPPRTGFALAGDPATGRAFLFGGQDGSTVLADFWLWNGTDWQQLPGGPSARIGHTMCYRDDAQRVVLYGGTNNSETWEWDGAQWLLRSANYPPHSGDASLAWHPIRRRSVLTTFGVFGLSVWEWDGANWFSTNPPTRPSIPSLTVRSAYDPVRERVIAFDLQQASNLGQAHEWDGAAWRSFAPDARLHAINLWPAGIPGVGLIAANGEGALTLQLTNDFPASATSFGAACPDPQRRVVSTQPWLGTSYTLRYAAAAGTVCVFASGFSDTQYGGVPLPLDLGLLGLPGCELLVAPELLAVTAPVAGEATLSIALPPSSALAGTVLFHQAAALSSAFTAASQGLRVVAGSLW